MKTTLLLLSLGALSAVPAMADIYKYRGADGSIVFSDQRNPNGADEVIEMSSPNVVPAPSAPERGNSQAASGLTKQAKPSPQDLYSSLSIVSPGAGEAVRANDGVVTVKVDSVPPLDVGAGDLVRLVLDGTPAAQGMSTNVALDNLDRGDHQVYAEIVDADGEILERSTPVKFHVLRHSVLFNRN